MKRDPLSISFVIGLVFLVSGCEKWQLDQQVQELCAKDGGVKVYEVVKLPTSKFDKWGLIKLYSERQEIRDAYRNDEKEIHMEHALGIEYVFSSDDYFYRKGNPSMVRYRHQVVRRSDGKLIGETVSYGRGGGDLPGPWEPSNSHCPPTSESSEIALLKKIFIPTNQE